jgi:hypothetical protein
MTKVRDLHVKWMKKKEYRTAYQELAPEFTVARAAIKARTAESDAALWSHIEQGYLQAERGELIDGAQVRREIQAMKVDWRLSKR